jgi:hypothetical protein
MVGFGTTKLTRVWEPALLWNQLHSVTTPEGGVGVLSQDVHPKHPPDKEYCDDGPRDVNYPVASRFRVPKIEHAAMVAGPTQVALYPDSTHL